MKQFLLAATILAPLMAGLAIAAGPDKEVVWRFPTAMEGRTLALALPREVK
jgi:hypothetical protein